MSATIQTLEPAERPPTTMGARLEGELMEVSMGPQHPSTHGVFRMNVALEGEIVRKLKPVFGYLHRNHEKIGENTSYLGSMPYTDRLDYFCSMTNNWAYALSVDRKSTRLNSSHSQISYAVFCLKKKKIKNSNIHIGVYMGDHQINKGYKRCR